MKIALLTVALLGAFGITEVMAECQIGDAKLEEAILQNPKLRGPANSQSVRALRSLRDAAFTLWSYGRNDDCERLLDNIRELISGPSMSSLGGNDEEEADQGRNHLQVIFYAMLNLRKQCVLLANPAL